MHVILRVPVELHVGLVDRSTLTNAKKQSSCRPRHNVVSNIGWGVRGGGPKPTMVLWNFNLRKGQTTKTWEDLF